MNLLCVPSTTIYQISSLNIWSRHSRWCCGCHKIDLSSQMRSINTNAEQTQTHSPTATHTVTRARTKWSNAAAHALCPPGKYIRMYFHSDYNAISRILFIWTLNLLYVYTFIYMWMRDNENNIPPRRNTEQDPNRFAGEWHMGRAGNNWPLNGKCHC